MESRILKLALIFTLLVLSQASSAVMINLKSGNGLIGGADSEITYKLGPADSAFPNVFTATDFDDARNGPAAQIINRNGNWLDPSAFNGDTTANWISDTQNSATSNGFTALYAIDFVNPFASVLSAEMDLYWSVDNRLGGDGTNAGVFLNGIALAGVEGGSFGTNTPFLGVDIASLLVAGTNTLYFNVFDFGGPSGLLFSTDIEILEDTTQGPGPTPVPEPTTLILMGLGIVGLGYRKKQK
ncbi:MAG: PEP-CTERM sorting domain-containing protein [Pseudomonadota bacterium]